MNKNYANRERKKQRTVAAMAVIVGLLGVGTIVAIVNPWSKPPPVKAEKLGATLELAAGPVVLHGPDGDTALLSKTPLPEGAEVSTGPGARALIRLGDGSRVFLRDNSRVKLADTFTLIEGQLWLDAPPLEPEQDARVHNLGEQGYGVSLSDGGGSLSLQNGVAEVYVAEGLAIVTNPGGRAEVQSGQRAVLAAEGPPTVEPVAFWEDWTGGMGDRTGVGASGSIGAGALYAMDRSAPPGTPALPLTIQRQTVRVAIHDEVAETMVDQRFFNPSSQAVEGWYWFTVPEDAEIASFALETNGQLIEAEVVERKKAAQTYEAAVARQNDPALLEWIDERTVRARIFPVPGLGERRIVLRYQQLLSENEGKLRYSYPMAGPPGRDAATIEDFSLQVQLRGGMEQHYNVATRSDATVDGLGSRVSMRRSGFTPRADFELELTRKPGKPREAVRVNTVDPGGDKARFVMVRYAPDVDFASIEQPRGDVVVVVDTSAAGDASEQQTKLAVAEALLRSLSAGDRFAVMRADVTAEVLFPSEGLAEATPEKISQALESVAKHSAGGATDLGAIFEQALSRVHGLDQPAIVYIGDGLVTSGERDGDALSERLRRSITGSSARLFTMGVGADIDQAMLTRLARVGGGDFRRVTAPEQAVVRALELSGALKTPTITELSLDLGEGLDDVFTNVSGKLSRGQELVLFARTHNDLPEEVTVRGRIGGEAFETTHKLKHVTGVIDRIVPRLWAAAHVDRLLTDTRGPQAIRGKVLSLGLEYGLMTPFTSFLALDSESAYAQQGITRRYRSLGLRLTADASRFAEPTKTTPLTAAAGFFSAPFGCGAMSDSREPPADNVADQPAQAGQAASTPKPTAAEKTIEEEQAPMGQAAPSHGDEGGKLRGESDDISANAKTASKEDSRNRDRWGADESEAPPPVPPPESVENARNSGILGSLKGSGQGGGGSRDNDGIGLGTKSSKHVPTSSKQIASDGPEGKKKKPIRRRVRKPQPVSPVARGRKLPCSDAAARSRSQRRVLWTNRLDAQPNMLGYLNVYESAAGSCEIKGWKGQRVFLQLLIERATNEQAISLLLAHFSGETEARNYLARGLLRRLVDPGLIAAVEEAMFGGGIDWQDVDRQLLLITDDDPAEVARQQLALVQEALSRAPGDPQGERRMLKLLVQHGQLSRALTRGRRLRDQGLMTPLLAQQLGELFARQGDEQQARRIYSEIVEFDPRSVASRRLLGDIFLRHGWYEHAYRQYTDLVELAPDDQTAVIRVALAAAGTGRTDEARRILRKVATGEGRPGPDDPRRFARLHATVLLAKLFADAQAGSAEIPADAVARELGRLQVFDGPATLTLLRWHDLGADLVLAPKPVVTKPKADDDKQEPEPTPVLNGDVIDGHDVGLYALHTQGGESVGDFVVRHRGIPGDREVAYEVITITWDGSKPTVSVTPGKVVPAQETSTDEGN